MAYEPPDFYEFEVSPDLYSPHNSPPTPALHYSDGAGNLKTALMTGAVVSFIVLIAKDAHRAFVTRAHWIPCDFLVLSAFSIQLLSLLNAQNQADATSSPTGHWVIRAGGGNSGGTSNALWQDFLTIHNSRTILCVFAAYVMPAMADRGLEHSWVRWVALVITVFHHVTSEFYVVKSKNVAPNVLRLWPRSKSEPRFYIYATTISLCFIFLILLLACANIAGRSIERIVAKKISLVLGEFSDGLVEKTHPHHHHSCWRTVKTDISSVDHSVRPVRHHAHDHSACLREVEGVLSTGNADINLHHSCWRAVEDAVRRVEKREENDHSCWKIIEDALARGDKAEEEQHRRHCHNCWRTVEESVLKAWIIVRAYSTQPVIGRSALTASAAIIVTIQLVITIVGGLAKEVNKQEVIKAGKTFKFIATILQSIFILLAWVLINLRWGIAAAYHTRSGRDSWRTDLGIEDFWTRHLRELQEAGETRPRQAQSIDDKIEQLASKESKTVYVPSVLLYVGFGMQWFLVSFSKVCWLFSLMIFHNKLMVKLYNFMFEKHIMYVFEDYPKYKKILEEVQMLGESPESLWVANRKSIVKAKHLTIQGNQDGECNCEDLVDFVSSKRSDKGLGLSCLYPHKHQTGLKFLCKKRPVQSSQPPQGHDIERHPSREREKGQLDVEEQFTEVSKKSWKMTAVSLLSIIVHLSHGFPPEVVKDCLNAYSQAWEIIDFVEETDTEADGVTSEAADKYFYYLQTKVERGDFPPISFKHAAPHAALEELKKESKSRLEPVESRNVISGWIYALNKEKVQDPSDGWKGNDSIDWKAAASGLAVYNLCNSIECDDESSANELLKELESCLADVINECLERVQHLLLLNSRKWALSRDERRLGKALYTAGKAKVIMEKLVWNKVAIVSYH